MHRLFIAMCVGLAIAALGNAVAIGIVLRAVQEDCKDRNARVEVTRSVWVAVLDELSDVGADDSLVQRLQGRVETALTGVDC